MPGLPSLFRPTVLALFALALGACTTAEDRLEQGVAAERSGDVAAAAARYVQALQKDATLGEARSRLGVTGRAALDFHLNQARQDRLRGDPVAAAESFVAADALVASARSVQVTLPVPGDYARRRRSALDDGIAALLRDGAAAVEQGRFDDALNRYEGVARFDPSPEQSGAAASARTQTLVRWSESELAAGHYRAAHSAADRALEANDGTSASWAALLAIREEALLRGTVAIAFLPVTPAAAGTGERPLVTAVNDSLELDQLAQDRPFVEPLAMAQVRRALRDRGLTRRRADAPAAAALARDLGAAFAVVPVLEQFSVTEQNVRESQRQTKTRRGAGASYTVRTGVLRFQARATYSVVDANGTVARRAARVSAAHTARFEEAIYAGDVNELSLRPAERRAFVGPGRAGARHDGVAHLAGELAAKLADASLDGIVERLP